MRIRKLALIAGAATLAAAPLAAQELRSAAPVDRADELGGESNIGGAALGIAIGAVLVYGLVELTDDDGDDDPISA